MDAPCTVILVKQSLPFELLGSTGPERSAAAGGYSDSDADTVS
jgi:hypothetical protein